MLSKKIWTEKKTRMGKVRKKILRICRPNKAQEVRAAIRNPEVMVKKLDRKAKVLAVNAVRVPKDLARSARARWRKEKSA